MEIMTAENGGTEKKTKWRKAADARPFAVSGIRRFFYEVCVGLDIAVLGIPLSRMYDGNPPFNNTHEIVIIAINTLFGIAYATLLMRHK